MSKNRKEWADALRAEVMDEDLRDGDGYLQVCAMRQDGSLYEIGRISWAMVYQNPEAAKEAISRIKFARSGGRKVAA